MNITVYLGSSEGARPLYREGAARLGRWLGTQGHTLIYGGSRMGLMGVLADAALAHGAAVVGVEPAFFLEDEAQHPGLTELIVTDTLAERQRRMIELGEAFIAFPGGLGTLQEITEVMVLSKLSRLRKPFCFLNLGGYYEPLRACFRHMAAEGFLDPAWAGAVRFAAGVEELAAVIGPASR